MISLSKMKEQECPFCCDGEEYDEAGLKYHLNNYCEVYKNTEEFNKPYYGYHKPESLVDIEKMLKFRLPTWKNKKYWDWCSSQRIDGYEWHHLIGKRYCDLLLVNIPKTQHDRIHHGTGYEEGEFETLLLEALTNLMRYIDEH